MARVLVIDDDFLVSRLLREHLSNEGHEVATVHMAEEGFQTALKTKPDLIMLDVNLPDATGFQICGRFRENPVTQSIPIIMMTGAARYPNQQAIGRQMGANEYILKPFNVVEVGDRVEKLIHPNRQTRTVATAAAPQLRRESGVEGGLPSIDTSTDRQASTLPRVEKTPLVPLPTSKPLNPHLETFVELFKHTPAASRTSSPLEVQKTVQAPFVAPTLTTNLSPKLEIVDDHRGLTEINKTIAAPVINQEEALANPQARFSSEPAAIPAPTEIPVAETPIPSLTTTPSSQASPVNCPDPAILPDPTILPITAQRVPALPDERGIETSRSSGWVPSLIFAGHLGLSVANSMSTNASMIETVRSASGVASGWALLGGLVVSVSVVLQIEMVVLEACQILGWAALPLMLRTFLGLLSTLMPDVSVLHVLVGSKIAYGAATWLRPLDIFEIAALLVLTLSLHKRKHASLLKSLMAGLIVGAAWILAGQGYFRTY